MDEDNLDEREFSLKFLQVWRRQQVGNAVPDFMQMAAWMDGTLNESAAAEIERQLSADLALLHAVLESRQALAMTPQPREIKSARALVSSRMDLSWMMDWLQPLFNPSIAVTTVALILIVGSGGFKVGEELAGISIEQRQQTINALLADELSVISGEG